MRKRMIWMAPLALIGMVVFIIIGGGVVMLLWNWLAPASFGLRPIAFWQAIGLLALCRILFGGFGLGGGCHHNSHYRIEGRVRDRVRERMSEEWEHMSPEQREKFRQGVSGYSGPQPSTHESKE